MLGYSYNYRATAMVKTLQRCTQCQGRKEITGLGMVTRKCTACSGIGYIDTQPTETVAVTTNTTTNTATKGNYRLANVAKAQAARQANRRAKAQAIASGEL